MLREFAIEIIESPLLEILSANECLRKCVFVIGFWPQGTLQCLALNKTHFTKSQYQFVFYL